MILLFFIFITILGALGAGVLFSAKKSILALWLFGMGLGGVFLSCGAEYLAVFQWITSTALTPVLFYHSLLFGEENKQKTFARPKSVVSGALAMVSSILFFGITLVGVRSFFGNDFSKQDSLALIDLGKAIVEKNFIAFEFLALIFFVSIIGIGIATRKFDKDKEGLIK